MRQHRAPGWRRGAAAVVDLALGFGLALLLAPTTGTYFAERAVVTLAIGSPGTFWQGPIPMVLGIFGEVVYGFPFALLLVYLIEITTGASPGKQLLRLRICPASGGPLPLARRTARTALKASSLWMAALALASGLWFLLTFAAALAALALVDAALTALPARRSWLDRIAGTAVLRKPSRGRDAVPEAGLEPARPFRGRGF